MTLLSISKSKIYPLIAFAVAGSLPGFAMEPVCLRSPALVVQAIESGATSTMLAHADGYRIASRAMGPFAEPPLGSHCQLQSSRPPIYRHVAV